ncbi:unnamed protein product [Nyctereutes procyonoides]|uniref:(raccoon dog) hypothetical protein n=1 Tax=Nyctereutes procyonoides TaxID=34880 RepID=A0A811ZW17_NYCPR|nr:major allergen I polypeptide chain 1-like [Nyctereutes procyonoides]CAD7692813.1 unnamed protein product [Nyctereutes procyonoides]
MKRVGALLLLGAALLLASGGDCKICSAVRDDVNLFLTGSTEDYVDNVARYQSSPVILENAKLLKECLDGKMTEDDKQNALSVLDKIYASNLC